MKYLSLFSSAALMLSCGCSSIIDAHKQKAPLMEHYNNARLTEAVTVVNEKLEDRKDTGDELMWALEAGAINFDAGDYPAGLKAFEQAEKIIEAFRQRADISARDAGAEAGSAFTNLNALPYKGFCYDIIMLNVYKALTYYAMNNPDAAMVELRRLRDTQKELFKRYESELEEQRKEIDKEREEMRQNSQGLEQGGGEINSDTIMKSEQIATAMKALEEKTANTYGNLMNPFATYMSAIGYYYEKNLPEALVDLRNLYAMNNSNVLTNRDYLTVAKHLADPIPEPLQKLTPYDHPLQNNIVFVIFANGRGPALVQEKFWLILPWVGYTGLAFPRYEYHTPFYSGFTVSASGTQYPGVEVADMDKIASQEYKDRLPLMITRIVISYLVKETASLVATQAAMQANAWAGAAAYVGTGIYKYLFNTADTRCWETIPRQFIMTHLPIPKNRELTITTLPEGLNSKSFNIRLKDSTRFAIVYIRSVDAVILTQKVCEF